MKIEISNKLILSTLVILSCVCCGRLLRCASGGGKSGGSGSHLTYK